MKYNISFDLEFLENKLPGKLIVIEGVDGAGKTSQVERLFKKLKDEGVDVISTKEPTDLVIGKFIREKILTGELSVSPIALQYLFNADRVMHLEQINDWLKSGKTVIMDRYFWSSVAYALADLGGVMDYYLTAFSILSFYHQFLIPDVTIYLDLKVEKAVERIRKSHKHLEIYDHEHKIREILKGYNFLLEKFGEKFTVINGDQEIEKVTEEIWDKIKS